MTTVGVMVKQGVGPPHHTFGATVLRVWIWVIVVVVVLIGVTAAITIVIFSEGAPVLRPIGTHIQIVLDAITISVRVLVEVVAAVAI